jgi:hypothetical protein
VTPPQKQRLLVRALPAVRRAASGGEARARCRPGAKAAVKPGVLHQAATGQCREGAAVPAPRGRRRWSWALSNRIEMRKNMSNTMYCQAGGDLNINIRATLGC